MNGIYLVHICITMYEALILAEMKVWFYLEGLERRDSLTD